MRSACAAMPDDDLDRVDPAPTLRLRTVWISDIHLGTPGCHTQALRYSASGDSTLCSTTSPCASRWRPRSHQTAPLRTAHTCALPVSK